MSTGAVPITTICRFPITIARWTFASSVSLAASAGLPRAVAGVRDLAVQHRHPLRRLGHRPGVAGMPLELVDLGFDRLRVLRGLELRLQRLDLHLVVACGEAQPVRLQIGGVGPAPADFGERALLGGLFVELLGRRVRRIGLARSPLELGRGLVRLLGRRQLALGLQLGRRPLLILAVSDARQLGSRLTPSRSPCSTSRCW